MQRNAALICHIVYRLDYGGLENGLVNLVNNLPRERFRHAIVCLAGFGALRSRVARADVPIVSIDKREGKDFPSYVRTWRVLRSLRPDIVHTRNLGTVDLQWVARIAGVPHRVHGEHGWEAADPLGRSARTKLIRRACRPVIERYVAMSRDIERWLADEIGVPAARVRQLYNGVDTERFVAGRPLPPDWPWRNLDRQGVRVFGTVGRCDPLKNQLALVDAFAELVSQTGADHSPLRLVIVGDGPARSQLAQRVREQRLDRSVWLPGARADTPELLSALDVFVLPSLNEGISNTILEAMATGLPVVAARVGGNIELVEHERTGLLCDDSRAATLASAMLRYAADPALARRHGAAGRVRVERHFSLDSMIRAYTSFYDEVLAGPNAGLQQGRRTEVQH
jgi:sugar transferase (PEP-CTERM/EpsH1 system associated)